MIDALSREGSALRGIAVIGDGTTDAELDAMDEADVRGVRCNFAGFLNTTPDPDLSGARSPALRRSAGMW
jgi:hypothetical protein